MTENERKVLDFCLIQVQILKDKQEKIRKELFDCKVQAEFFSTMIDDLIGDTKND